MRKQLIALALLGLATTPLMATECATTVEANDAMQFNTKSITVPKACKAFKVTLKHTGKLPVTAMGHNWVLARSEDVRARIAVLSQVPDQWAERVRRWSRLATPHRTGDWPDAAVVAALLEEIPTLREGSADLEHHVLDDAEADPLPEPYERARRALV